MGLTDYRVLLIDCDEVLVDRDAGVWAALQPLFEQCPSRPDKEPVLAAFKAAMQGLYPRFHELGFSGLLCFAHRQMAEQMALKSSWEEGMSFARSVPNWTLFEDAPGAMLYLRKFYRVLVCVDRDVEDRGLLCERLGLGPENLVSLAGTAADRSAMLLAHDCAPADTLLLSRPPAQAPASGGLCLVRRARVESRQSCPADFCISSMADFVGQHQLCLRR